MARISGVDLPRNKRVDIGLTYVFGIGDSSAQQIVKAANIFPSTRCGELTDEEVTKIRSIVDENYQVEGDLRRVTSQNVKRLIEIGSAAAAIVVTKVGCAPAMPNLEEIIEFMKFNNMTEGV